MACGQARAICEAGIPRWFGGIVCFREALSVVQLSAQATAAHVLFESPELATLDEEVERPRRSVGLGYIVALHYCASTLYPDSF